MRGCFRLAIVLAAFWLFGCIVVLLVELSQLPARHECTSDKPSFEVFFKAEKIEAVYVRYPPIGVLAFPATMSREEIEEAIHRFPMKYYDTTNATIQWNVQVDNPNKTSNYYDIIFDRHKFVSAIIFPAIAIFISILVVGCGVQWVVQGLPMSSETHQRVPDREGDLFEDYDTYAKVLRTWFVAYGIGGPVLLLNNDAVRTKLASSGCARSIALYFLIGVGLQVLFTLFNKAALWCCYKAAREPKLRNRLAHRVAEWFAYVLWLDLLVDLFSLSLFAVATYRVFIILTIA